MGNAGRFASGSAQTPRPKVSFFVLSVGQAVCFACATFPKVNLNYVQRKKFATIIEKKLKFWCRKSTQFIF